MSGNFFSKVQNFFGVTRSELIMSFLILGGLLLGLPARYYLSGSASQIRSEQDLAFTLDSIAEADRTSFISTDYENAPIEELASGDTIIAKETFFPVAKKEIEPNKPLLVNINTASRVELARLPGVGDKTAQKIIKYREKSAFASPGDIMKIKGIGPKKFEKMKAFIAI